MSIFEKIIVCEKDKKGARKLIFVLKNKVSSIESTMEETLVGHWLKVVPRGGVLSTKNVFQHARPLNYYYLISTTYQSLKLGLLSIVFNCYGLLRFMTPF